MRAAQRTRPTRPTQARHQPTSVVRPFAALPHDLVADPKLTPTDKTVAAALLFWARGKASCWPSDSTIGARVGRSVGTVQRSLRRLEVAGWIRRERTDRNRTGRLIVLSWRAAPSAPALDPLRSPARDEERRSRKETKESGPDSVPRERPEEPSPLVVVPPAPVPGEAKVDPCRLVSNPAETADPVKLSTGLGAAVLTPAEAARLEVLAPAVRDRVLGWLASGDPILLAEACALLRPPAPPKPAPATLPELLQRVREDPANVPAAAAALVQAFDDQKSYSGFLARVGEAFEGRRDPGELVEALRQASGPKARNRGAVFMTVCGRIRE
jgi:DNA-binding Lrp family transcriptional regulator